MKTPTYIWMIRLALWFIGLAFILAILFTVIDLVDILTYGID